MRRSSGPSRASMLVHGVATLTLSVPGTVIGAYALYLDIASRAATLTDPMPLSVGMSEGHKFVFLVTVMGAAGTAAGIRCIDRALWSARRSVRPLGPDIVPPKPKTPKPAVEARSSGRARRFAEESDPVSSELDPDDVRYAGLVPIEDWKPLP